MKAEAEKMKAEAEKVKAEAEKVKAKTNKTNAQQTQSASGWAIPTAEPKKTEVKKVEKNANGAVLKADAKYMEGAITTNAEGKVDKQLSDIESLIANNCDVIIIRATDSAGVVSGFEACAEAGIPTIDSGFGSNYEDTLKILSSQVFLCNLQADYCLDWLEQHPDETLKCGYIWGVQGVSSTQDRYDGWHDKLMANANGRAEVLAEKVCNWSATETMAAVEDWVQAYPEMNCIVAMSDEMALAASNVLQAAGIGLDKCIVVGIDGSPAAQEALRAGTLSATVYTSKRADAALTFEYAVRVAKGEDLRGQTVDPGNEISALMTADNLDEILNTLG